MAENKYYITAGLPASKDDAVTPGAGDNTVYITAGLPPAAKAAGGGLSDDIILAMWMKRRQYSLIER